MLTPQRTLLARSSLVIALLAASSGCSSNVDTATSGGTGGNSGGSGSTSASSSTSGSGAGGSDGGAGKACSTNADCSASEYCLHPWPTCGAQSGGTCTPRKMLGCDLVEPRCGCDGKIYQTPCEAAAAGVDTTVASACPAPAGRFECDFTYCDLATELCSVDHIVHNGACAPATSCAAIPPNCQPSPTCACVIAPYAGLNPLCSGDAASGMTVETHENGC